MTTTFIRSEESLHRDAGPDVIAMVTGDAELHVLSGPAAVIWHLLAEARGLDDVTDEVARVYQRPADEVRASVEACIHTLVGHRLAQERP